MRPRLLLVTALALLSACASPDRSIASWGIARPAQDDLAPAHTYVAHRGAFGFDTSTVDPGTFEFEFGVSADPDSDIFDVPVAIKYGAGDDTEIFSEFSGYQYESRPGAADAEGFGDLSLAVRHRLFRQNDWPSLALQFYTTLPTGNEPAGLSSGEIDFRTAAIATKDFDQFAATFYYELGVIGNSDGGTQLEHAFALITEVPVDDRWGVFCDLVAELAPEVDSETWTTGFGASFNVAHYVAWDLGVRVGLNRDATDLEIFTGFTWSVGGPSQHSH